jgi:hypothetical protein
VSSVKDLASTVTSSDQTKQQKIDAAKSLGTQISADAKAASGKAKDKITTLGNDVSALADDLKNGASADQIKQDLSNIASTATGAAAACLTQ